MDGADLLLTNATVATMSPGAPYGLIPRAAVAIRDGRIAWVGAEADLPAELADLPPRDLGGRLVTPALIDCHTHVVHGGDRALEFEMRLQGASYEAVARAGGGIVATVRRDPGRGRGRAAGAGAAAGRRADRRRRRRRSRSSPATASTARPSCACCGWRGASARRGRFAVGRASSARTRCRRARTADAYIDEVCIPALRAAQAEGLVDAVDGFCEGIAFQPAADRAGLRTRRRSWGCR